MGMGIGKSYWVRIIKYKYGSLEECLEFINKLKSDDTSKFFELRPIPIIEKKHVVKCTEYCVTYVEDGN